MLLPQSRTFPFLKHPSTHKQSHVSCPHKHASPHPLSYIKKRAHPTHRTHTHTKFIYVFLHFLLALCFFSLNFSATPSVSFFTLLLSPPSPFLYLYLSLSLSLSLSFSLSHTHRHTSFHLYGIWRRLSTIIRYGYFYMMHSLTLQIVSE